MSKFTVKYDKVCATCGKQFVSASKRAMFCSRNCKSKSYVVTKFDQATGTWPKVCKRCGRAFNSTSKTTRMCPDCSVKSQRESVLKWRNSHPDWQKNWNREHPESIKRSKQKWNAANPDKVAEHGRRHTERKRQARNELRRYKAIARQREMAGSAVEYRRTSKIDTDEFVPSLNIRRVTANRCLCLGCNNEFYISSKESSAYRNLMNHATKGKSPCPFCGDEPVGYRNTSSGSRYEHELASLYPNFTVRSYRPEWMGGKEIDLFDPVSNVGVEFHGLFAHSDRTSKTPSYHEHKADLCEANGVQLIQVYETEWVQHREQVIDKLDAIFHVNMGRKFARKLSVRELNDTKGREVANMFMDENHINGHSSSQWAVGLFDGDEPVAVCTFKYGTGYAAGGHVEGTEKYWELNRYATKLHMSVVGGISRCVKAFERSHPEVKNIVSFADRRWTCPSRSAYSSSGFVETGRCEPNYQYTDLNPGHPLHNKQFMRKANVERRAKNNPGGPEARVFSWDKTETEMSRELGFYKIYDAGKIRYEISING